MFERALQQEIYGNTVRDYLIFAGLLIIGSILIALFRKVVLSRMKRWAERSETTVDDFLVESIERAAIPLLYYGIFALGIRGLALHPIFARAIDVAGLILLTYIGVRLITSAVAYLIHQKWIRKTGQVERDKAASAFMPAVQVAIWGLGLLYLLDNLGFKISAVIAGLGIGGIAVALAAQTVLKDTFSYFAILLDRPFEVGDFIIVGDFMGSVEYIGVKTTRIRSLSGEQLIFSNSDLTDSRLRNYKRMDTRRVVFQINVSYETPRELLERIPQIVADIIKREAKVVLDRVHLATMGDFSLRYEAVYIVQDSDYNLYMDIQQRINLGILEAFEKTGIRIAYPTQTLYVQAGPGWEQVMKAGARA